MNKPFAAKDRQPTSTSQPTRTGARVALAAVVIVAVVGLSAVPAQSASGVTISAKLSRTKVIVGTAVTASGKVSPSRATQRVVLQRKVGVTWRDVGAGLVNQSTGAYTIRVRPSQAGFYTMRVRSNGGTVVSRVIMLKASFPAPGSPCTLGSFPDCIDPDEDGYGEYLINGAECMNTIGVSLGAGICSDLDGDGVAGYFDSQ